MRQGGDVLDLHRAGHHAGRPVHREPRAAAAEREGDGTKAAQADRSALGPSYGAGAAEAPPRRCREVLADRGFALKGGPNAVVLAVPAKVKAGRFRLTISVSDGLGGGRTCSGSLRSGRERPRDSGPGAGPRRAARPPQVDRENSRRGSRPRRVAGAIAAVLGVVFLLLPNLRPEPTPAEGSATFEKPTLEQPVTFGHTCAASSCRRRANARESSSSPE